MISHPGSTFSSRLLVQIQKAAPATTSKITINPKTMDCL